MCVNTSWKNTKDKNKRHNSNRNALNYDGKNGYLNVCKYIMEIIEDQEKPIVKHHFIQLPLMVIQIQIYSYHGDHCPLEKYHFMQLLLMVT